MSSTKEAVMLTMSQLIITNHSIETNKEEMTEGSYSLYVIFGVVNIISDAHKKSLHLTFNRKFKFIVTSTKKLRTLHKDFSDVRFH
jgi:hypothetical protein